MSNKILIDASHKEETRVVVTRGNRIEEIDFESEHKKQLKGNIYLARITRVEPSLQAAFVEYGGNRHGFLAFSEIHPDYYQIPVTDRLALLEAEEQATKLDNENSDFIISEIEQKKLGKEKSRTRTVVSDVVSEYPNSDRNDTLAVDNTNSEDTVEFIGAEDALEEVPTQRVQRRNYRIQEVIKRRQILLVQIMKEERGNKGAALTTYLSLAGRYSVLMPNTARGGGISRKITSIADRKRLREILKDLSVPKGMGIILRTAGANRTKAEVKRDYEYLMRLWENVRNLTLNSIAPSLVYEESSLIKRSIRDLYNKDIDEILVAGEKGYREAKDFMRMLMPSQAKVVQPYRDKLPIFARNGIESRLDHMLQPEVSLKSGGYLVINQTEALVAIDVNSGRSIKEHSVEEMAVQTNLEAAEEIARQLKLRDLAGLIVIDFIDMLEKCNIRAVEKKLKDCLKEDRARIQVGRISHFGLMEMSRQRIRTSVFENTTQPCPHCVGSGYIRSKSSIAIHIIRSIEEYLLRNDSNNIIVRTPVSTALYVLNHKRKVLTDLEEYFGLTINIEADDTIGSQHLAIYKGSIAEQTISVKTESPAESGLATETKIPTDEKTDSESIQDDDYQPGHKRPTKRAYEDTEKPAEAKIERFPSPANSGDDRKRKRRRGRRGGRHNREYDLDCRVQSAEPIGSFAKAFLAEFESEHSPYATTAAELVGPFSADFKQKSMAIETLQQEKKATNRIKIKKLPVEKEENLSQHKGKRTEISEQKAKEKTRPTHKRQKKTAKKENIPIAADTGFIEKSGSLSGKKAKTAEIFSSIAEIKTDERKELLKPKKTGWWQRKGSFF
ncbi:MAG: ribonuclease E [Candidatus Tokpelaia sp. JSC189]|nr:MAG: ribonuclease E [Candidatus Tokpelaia sp. JSC189]